MITAEKDTAEIWQIVIFMVKAKADHCGLSIPSHGLADLSLHGARVIRWDSPSLPKGERLVFDILLPSPRLSFAFLRKPGLLMLPIIKQEQACRGWHMTADAPDYVRQFRDQRSRDPKDMNCVEWILYGLEHGGVIFPNNVLTPTDLHQWCVANCIEARERPGPSSMTPLIC